MLLLQTDYNKTIDAPDTEKEDVSVLTSPALFLCTLKGKQMFSG